MIAIRSAMRPLVPTALALAGHPMPRCADTRGIYAGLVDILYQAVTTRTSRPVLAACAGQHGY